MLRYATPPIIANSRNASENPAAIFRPKVHMLSLLWNGALPAAFLDCLSEEGNAHYRPNHVCRPRDVRHVGASYVLLLGGVELRLRQPQVAFEIAKRQGKWFFGFAQNQPSDLTGFGAIAEQPH